jgi:hypothetical protein
VKRWLGFLELVFAATSGERRRFLFFQAKEELGHER